MNLLTMESYTYNYVYRLVKMFIRGRLNLKILINVNELYLRSTVHKICRKAFPLFHYIFEDNYYLLKMIPIDIQTQIHKQDDSCLEIRYNPTQKV